MHYASHPVGRMECVVMLTLGTVTVLIDPSCDDGRKLKSSSIRTGPAHQA